MEVKEITEEEFYKVIKEKGKVLIDCYATWCGPCRMMAPIIDRIAKEKDNCKFYKLDVDQTQRVSIEYGINSIPTLLFFEDGDLKVKSVGLISKDNIENIIENS